MNEEEFIAKLKDAAGRMQADGIDPIQIQGFIDQKKNEWKAKNGGKTNAAAEETATVVADQPSALDSQLGVGLSEPPLAPEPGVGVNNRQSEEIDEPEGFFEWFSDKAIKGSRAAGATAETINVMAGARDEESLKEFSEAVLEAQSSENIIESQQLYAKKVERFKQQGDNGFVAGFKAFADNPILGAEVMISSLAGMATSAYESPAIVAGTTVAGAAVGAGAAAAAGSIGGPVGTAIGAIGGTYGGALAGLRMGSMALMEAQATFTELFQEKLAEKNLNIANTDHIRQILDDEDAVADMRRKAIGRGVAIGTVEAIFGKLAGGVGSKFVNKASRVSKLKGAVAAVGIEAAGGMAGETAGMLAADQELAGEEIFLEGVAGTVFAPASVAVETFSKKAEYRLNGEKQSDNSNIVDIVNNSSDEDFVNAKINVSRDESLSKKVNERRKKIIKNNKQAAKEKITPKKAEDLRANIKTEIKKAEKEYKELLKTDGELVAEVKNKEIQVLKSRLEELNDHIQFQLDDLGEDELLSLMDMDDNIGLYQSILNDPSSTEAAKASAKIQIEKLKNDQINVLNDTDAADLARPDGPRKQKNVDLSQKTQDAYERGGKNAWGEIADHQMGTVRSIATSLWSRIPEDKKVGTYDDFVAGIISEPGGLKDMVASYKPELGVPLAAYLGDRKKGLRARANRIVKKFTKQDIQSGLDSKEAMSTFAEGIDIDAIDLGPEFLYQKLGLGKILGDLTNDVEIALTKTEGELSKLGEVTQKKRQATAEKAFNSVFTNKYDKKIKEFIGKNTKNDDSFSKFINNNFTTLRKIALSNIDFQKGSGISNTWNQYAPNLEDFLDYYEGKDIGPDQPASTKNDRKNKLVKAIEAQLANDARESYFRERPTERAEFNEQQRISFQEATEVKKIRIFDFDDTLAQSNSQVLYTLPDGTKGKLNATEYAKQDKELKEKGAEFDFSEFSKVIDGEEGPLLGVAKKINAARGNEDLFVLTARPADSAGPIQDFLKSVGIEFKKENIIGLGDGTAQAKADWVQSKIEEGYNDFYFADDAIKNVEAVKEVLENADVKSKVQQAIAFQEAVDEITNTNGISEKTIEEKIAEYEEMTVSLEDQLTDSIGGTLKENKKLLTKYRNQKYEESQLVRDFVTNVLPTVFSKEQMEMLKPTFTSSSSRMLFGSDKSVFSYKEAFDMMEFIDGDVMNYDSTLMGKTAIRPTVSPKQRKNLSLEEQKQFMLDDYKKRYDKLMQLSESGKYEAKRKEQYKFLKDILNNFAKVYSGNEMEIAAIFATQSESMSHFIRRYAPFLVLVDPSTLTLDDVLLDSKGRPKLLTEEHSFKANLAARAMFNMVKNNNVDAKFDDLMAIFYQTALAIKDDNLLNETYKDTMPPNTYFGDPLLTLRVYQEVGIDITKYVSLINNAAERLGIDSNGVIKILEVKEATKNKTPDKIQSAIQFQEANSPNPELTNNERVEGLTDLFNSVYGTKATRNKQEAIDYLVSIGFKEETAKNAVEQKGFRVPGLIYVNEQLAGVDTPMHEFTHEWAELVNKADPELFNAIYNKLTDHPRFEEATKRMADSKIYSQYSPDSFEYKNEVMAHILGEEGKSLYEIFESDAEAKSLIDKFFDYVKEALGFDPATKNFADLTVDEVIKLAVKDITEGNPAANFNKLKNVAEGKSWFAKSEAAVSPSAKAKADPILRALNKLKLSYRENKDLAQAIFDAYDEVKGIMTLTEFARLMAQSTKEITTGKTKQLLIAKAEVIKANKIAEENVKKQAEAKISEDKATELQNKFRRLIYIATAEGAKPSKWFIPPNAEDIKGLLYAFLPKGKQGVEARKWMEETILKPYSDAIAALDTEILHKSKAWADMSKGFDFNKKVDGTPYTLGDAIKVYNAMQDGKDPGIAKKAHVDALIHAVESNSEILDIANEVAESFPIELTDGWQNRSFASEIYNSINDGARKRHLVTFSENVDAIFTDATLDLIADQMGPKFRQALVSTLRRMKSGRNRTTMDANANSYMNWLNRAVGTTMFLNTRSAVLQLLSTLNFIGKPDNNIFAATAAFADRKQWKEDYNKLWNSDYLVNRRDGAKFDVLADEIAQDPDNWISKLLQKGFLPTRYADSYAIAFGGAGFYRNRANSYIAQGMSKADAEAQAMIDWREAAEESQQSSDPSKISEIQASSIGKVIYAFANTPFQYARIVKRKLQDITSGRSAAEGNVRRDMQSILYYAGAQALVFNALQSGLVALLMSDDEDDEKLKNEKYALMIERSLTSFAKSTGNPGAVASTLYAVLKEGYDQQTGKRRPDGNALAITATSISPPINSKLRDIAGAYRAFNKIEEGDLLTPSLDNEALTMAGEVAAFTGVPLDRAIRKARHLAAISNEEVELWQKIWMLAGWSEWELGVDLKKKNDFKAVGFKDIDFEDVEFEDTAFNRLERGVAGKAHKDGTIEVDPNLSPVEREKTIAHEKQHIKDIKAGKLDYDDNFVYWNGGKHKRENGMIEYKGKMVEEGHPSLPWEKKAYDAEPSTKEIKEKKKRTKLY